MVSALSAHRAVSNHVHYRLQLARAGLGTKRRTAAEAGWPRASPTFGVAARTKAVAIDEPSGQYGFDTNLTAFLHLSLRARRQALRHAHEMFRSRVARFNSAVSGPVPCRRLAAQAQSWRAPQGSASSSGDALRR
jgi:hypothetical protein